MTPAANSHIGIAQWGGLSPTRAWIPSVSNVSGSVTAYLDINGDNAQPFYGNTSYSSGSWVNIVFTWNSTGNVLSTYKNGTLIASGSQGTLATSTGAPIYVGGTFNLAANKSVFLGDLAVVRIWGRTLSGAEVTNDYNYFGGRFGLIATTTSTTTTTTAGPSPLSIARIDYPSVGFESINGSVISVTASLDDPASGEWEEAGVVWSTTQTRPEYPTNHMTGTFNPETQFTEVSEMPISVNTPLYWWAYDQPSPSSAYRYSAMKNWAWYGSAGIPPNPKALEPGLNSRCGALLLVNSDPNSFTNEILQIDVNGLLGSGPISQTMGYITAIKLIYKYEDQFQIQITPDWLVPGTYESATYTCTPLSESASQFDGEFTTLQGQAFLAGFEPIVGSFARLVVIYSSGLVAQSDVIQITSQ
jgi:hypothetical protein